MGMQGIWYAFHTFWYAFHTSVLTVQWDLTGFYPIVFDVGHVTQ